jgi:hypothetical protein
MHSHQLFRVNVRGPYFLLKYAVPAMTDSGSIILTSSMGALKGMPGLSVYSATKSDGFLQFDNPKTMIAQELVKGSFRPSWTVSFFLPQGLTFRSIHCM